MISAGLLGYFGAKLPSGQLDAAHEIAPWRGEPGKVIDRSFGTICALGSAQAGDYGHVSVAIHGRIDRMTEIAKELHADPEDPCAVIAAAYKSYGDEFARRLTGDFAILVLDAQRGAVVGARDWIGARPLFWGKHNDVVAFGSEVKQVLALLGVPFQLDLNVLQLYRDDGDLALDTTFAADCWAVMPSGQVVATLVGQPKTWRTSPRFEPLNISLQEAVPQVLRLLETAVSRRTAGGRLGSQISGGMDSTTLTAVAAALAERAVGPPVLAGFTMAYPDNPTCDETSYASSVAAQWKIPWYPIALPPSALRGLTNQTLVMHDGPVMPQVAQLSNFMGHLRATNIDILLCGEGADSWLEQRGNEIKIALLQEKWLPLVHWTNWSALHFPRRTLRHVLSACRSRLKHMRAEEIFEIRSGTYWLRAALEALEREGTRQGIRVEFPYCDSELVAFLAGLPVSLRSTPSERKVVIREAMRGLLPEEVRTRRSETYADDYLQAALTYREGDNKPFSTWEMLYADAAEQLWGHPIS